MLNNSKIPIQSKKEGKYKQECNSHKEEISGFTEWLKKRNYANETIRADSNYTASFIAWAGQEQTQITEVTYNDLLMFIDHCISGGDSKNL
jgi:hypothetical protein